MEDDMEKPTLYRRRFIPDETVMLKDDVIEHMDDEVIVTRWRVLKPRKDFQMGRSCYFLRRGFKVSRFMDADGRCVYHYCDIIDAERNPAENAYVFNDLLVDVIVYNDGFVKVMDLGEVPEAVERKLITAETAMRALARADELLRIIYAGRFHELTAYLD